LACVLHEDCAVEVSVESVNFVTWICKLGAILLEKQITFRLMFARSVRVGR
jgi:hypothetical protein